MNDLEVEDSDYHKALKKKYPLESIEKHIQAIEKMGYSVGTSKDSFQIWDGSNLLIDADFNDDYYLNAIEGIDSFYG